MTNNTVRIGLGLALLGLLIPFLAGAAAAEEPALGSLTGIIMVKGTRLPKPQLAVQLKDWNDENRTWGTVTDDRGAFVFDHLRPGDYVLTVTDELSEPFEATVTVRAGKPTRKNCYLQSLPGYEADEVTVIGKREPEVVSRQELKKEELTGVPGANNDPIRVLESLPGVASTSVMGFGNDGLVIRGTGPEDSGYKLNGLEIPQLFHFGGMNSIVNAELLQDIVYYPGAYSVKYGNALGGIVELTNREPRTDRLGGLVDLNTYATFMIFEGPLGKNASGAVGVRRSFIDFILPVVIPKDQAQFTLAPRFYDYQAIVNYHLGNDHLLQLFAFGSDDGMSIIDESDERKDPFSSETFNIRVSWHQPGLAWTWTPNERVSNCLHVNYLYSDEEYEFGDDFTLKGKTSDIQFRDDFSVQLAKWNELRLGIDGDYGFGSIEANVPHAPREGEPGFDDASEETYHIDVTGDVFQPSFYVEDVINPASWLNIVPGARVNYQAYIGKTSYDPRLSAKVFPWRGLALKAATGLYHQWPSLDEYLKGYGNENLDTETAELYAGGAEYDFGEGWTVDLQGYYKRLYGMVVSGRDGEPVYTNDGQGKIHGVELLARKRLTDRFMGWVSYTYTVSRRKDNADADWRYFDQDQTHNFVVLASYILGAQKDWRLGAKFQFTSGLPYTDIRSALYNADTDSYIPVYDEQINGEREKPYHKLDIRIDKIWTFNSWQLTTYLDVQNVYWNKYPVGYEYNYDYTEKKAISFPAFMPTVGLQGRF